MNALRAAIVHGARRTVPGGPLARGTRPGDGFVFDRLRAYTDGDDPRRIDWSATARTGTLQARVYLEETQLVLAAILDGSASMGLGRRRRLATAAGEALQAWLGAAERGDRVARLVGDRLVGDPFAATAAIDPERFELRRALVLALGTLPRGASLLLITDALDLDAGEADDELLFRVAQRYDATVLVARDPWLEELPLRGLVRVRDVESGQTRRLLVGARTRERYRRASQARDERFHARFSRARWRVGTLDEVDGRRALERTFGLR